MSIIHTVVFSLRQEPGSSEEAAFLQAARETLSQLPSVRDFTVRRQVSAFSGFRFQFSMVFADRDAYDAYNLHPAHVDFVENRWKAEVTDFQEYDFVEDHALSATRL